MHLLCRDRHRVASRRSETSQVIHSVKHCAIHLPNQMLSRVYITAFHQSSFIGKSPSDSLRVAARPITSIENQWNILSCQKIPLISVSIYTSLKTKGWKTQHGLFCLDDLPFHQLTFQFAADWTTNTEHNQKPSRIHGSKMCLVFQQLWQGLGLRGTLAILAQGLRVGHFVFDIPVGRNIKGTKNQSCTVIYKLIEIMRHISSWLITERGKIHCNSISIGTTSEVGTVSMKQPKRIIWKLLTWSLDRSNSPQTGKSALISWDLMTFCWSLQLASTFSSHRLENFGIRLRILKPIETPLHPMWPLCYLRSLDQIRRYMVPIHYVNQHILNVTSKTERHHCSLFTVASLSQAVAWRRTCHLCQFLRSLYTRSDISRSISYAHIVLDPGRFLNFGYSKWIKMDVFTLFSLPISNLPNSWSKAAGMITFHHLQDISLSLSHSRPCIQKLGQSLNKLMVWASAPTARKWCFSIFHMDWNLPCLVAFLLSKGLAWHLVSGWAILLTNQLVKLSKSSSERGKQVWKTTTWDIGVYLVGRDYSIL